MARPIKVGLSYFPLDTTFFQNDKVKNLRRKHGAIGVLTYLNILCKVYGKDGYYFKIPGGDKESFYIGIAEEIASGNDQIRQVTSRVRESIRHLLEQGMLDRDLFEKDVITGISLQEQYILSAMRARQKIKMDANCLVDVWDVASKNGINVTETPVNVTETPVNVSISTQKKEKENKENILLPSRACEDGTEDEARRQKRMGGSLGEGYVFLSADQEEDLLDRLSLDEFNHYVCVVRDCVKAGKKFSKSHYQAILEMAEKDRKIGK